MTKSDKSLRGEVENLAKEHDEYMLKAIEGGAPENTKKLLRAKFLTSLSQVLREHLPKKATPTVVGYWTGYNDCVDELNTLLGELTE